MNRWFTIRRMRGPAFLLLFGLTALLNQWGILSFGRSWPLYLILAGVLSVMERLAFREDQVEPPPGYMPPGYTPSGYPAPPAPYTQGTSIVPRTEAITPSDVPYDRQREQP